MIMIKRMVLGHGKQALKLHISEKIYWRRLFVKQQSKSGMLMDSI